MALTFGLAGLIVHDRVAGNSAVERDLFEQVPELLGMHGARNDCPGANFVDYPGFALRPIVKSSPVKEPDSALDSSAAFLGS